ncbi:hypothetical protein KXX13_003310 [Aspergillus fumigatus]|nr:hypothetical protein KXX13_003310 [Aspergillus fumigatus]KAH1525653.1 hypothetical protein KXX18_003807 [Aspergillus fumigatus]KAH1657745.1 hypothetical protein KXX15_004027 [Aspergillus fumigatus]KAH1928780.1 hypothetical protein KXV48_002874 [Aspergillus fumigatus]KAH2068458.1 hypothetical protein KXW32_002852 [Aspergillus fumigatus]
MSQSRSITASSKRPAVSLTKQHIHSDSKPSEALTAALQSSPLTEPSSSFLANNDSPKTPDKPAPQLKVSLQSSVLNTSPKSAFQSFQSSNEAVVGDHTSGLSFNSSQRIVKNGREVVISSDGEDTDSIASFEQLEDPLLMFMKPNPTAASETREAENSVGDSEMALPSQRLKDTNKASNARSSKVPQYKFSLDDLVTQAAIDNETEATIARLKAVRADESSSKPDTPPSRQLNEGLLTSALGDQDDELGLQRLLDAVRRTEALEIEKFWSFFNYEAKALPALEFPREPIAPGTYLAVLREPESRERAFHSGALEFALSRAYFSDELMSWIFHSVSCEPRESLRHAYCRLLKHTAAERIKSLFRPDDINRLFQRLGANPKALDISELVIPEPAPQNSQSQESPQRLACLLSVLELLRGVAELFADDTREHLLNILFRLALDISVRSNALICSELEKTITAVMESVPESMADSLLHRVFITAYDTIRDSVLQSRLLKHILPTSSRIAALRCRLALAFLTSDPERLTEAPDVMSDLKMIINLLKDRRFNINLYKGRGNPEYDYGELSAVTDLLNVAIDSGWSGLAFPTKEAEKDFNADVDRLSDRVKKIFVSIQDSGASHLKRTLAKEALETLHYRIIYSVRSKPLPKKTLLGHYGAEDGRAKYNLKQWIEARSREDKKDTQMPIRSHEHPS